MTAVLHPRPLSVDPRPWSFPSFERARLDNGIDVVACHLPSRPVVEARLIVPGAGLRYDDRAELGLAYVTGLALSEGTEERSGEEFADAVESLGARFYVEPHWEALIAAVSVPAARLDAALGLLTEAVVRPRLAEPDVERVVRRTLANIVAGRRVPGMRTNEEFAAVLFDPASRMAMPGEGTPATLEALSAEHVRRFCAARLAPTGATLVVVGDLAGIDLDGAVSRTVGAWTAGPDVGARVDLEPEGHRPGRRIALVDFPGAVQTELMMGQAGPPVDVDDRAALRIANHYLGGYFGSRLNLVLREQKAITYGTGSGLEHRGAAFVLRIAGAVQSDATGEAVQDTLAEVQALATGAVDEVIFGDAVDNVVRTMPIVYKTTDNIAAALVNLVVERLPDDYFDRVGEQLRATTAAVAAETFARYVSADDISVAGAGDAARVAPLLEAVGPVSVKPAG